MAGFALLGIGIGPLFPSMVYETPRKFGADNAQKIIGYQMAAASLGGALFPFVFGEIAKSTSLAFFPLFLLLSGFGMLISFCFFYRSKSGGKKSAEIMQ